MTSRSILFHISSLHDVGFSLESLITSTDQRNINQAIALGYWSPNTGRSEVRGNCITSLEGDPSFTKTADRGVAQAERMNEAFVCEPLAHRETNWY